MREVNFHINQGEKVGLVGPNGSGKSTFVRILLGEVAADRGEVHRAKGLRVGYLPQDVRTLGSGSVLEHVIRVEDEVRRLQQKIKSLEDGISQAPREEQESLAVMLAECVERYRLLGGYDLRSRAEKVLAGLGFCREDFHRPLEELSGGWAMRVALARLLVLEPDLLLLDEPTNHLDIEALIWLEDYLCSNQSAVLVISHDRLFLNRVAQRIVELEDGRLISYRGNFDEYQRQKRHEEELRWSAYKAQQERIRQLEAFIERNRARKDRARQVQSRIRMLEEMERVEPPRRHDAMNFRLPEAPQSARVAVEIEGLSFGYHEPIFRGASLLVERGSKVAVLGPNGCGKSTLLRLIAGVISPNQGSVRLGRGVRVAYFSQDQMELLHPDRTVLEEAMDGCGGLTQKEVRTLLGGLGLRGEDVLKRVSTLSGGERSRLVLCKVLLSEANLLLLDEPTNHLDIPAREVLEAALKEFPGTLIFVTHDRRLMNAIADHVLEIKGGMITLYPGDYDDYVRIWAAGEDQHQIRIQGPAPRVRQSRRERRRMEAQWRSRLHQLRAPLIREMKDLEERAEELAGRIEEIRTEMADPGLYRSADRVRALTAEHKDLTEALEQCNRQWEKLALELEELNERMEREKP